MMEHIKQTITELEAQRAALMTKVMAINEVIDYLGKIDAPLAMPAAPATKSVKAKPAKTKPAAAKREELEPWKPAAKDEASKHKYTKPKLPNFSNAAGSPTSFGEYARKYVKDHPGCKRQDVIQAAITANVGRNRDSMSVGLSVLLKNGMIIDKDGGLHLKD